MEETEEKKEETEKEGKQTERMRKKWGGGGQRGKQGPRQKSPQM